MKSIFDAGSKQII